MLVCKKIILKKKKKLHLLAYNAFLNLFELMDYHFVKLGLFTAEAKNYNETAYFLFGEKEKGGIFPKALW